VAEPHSRDDFGRMMADRLRQGGADPEFDPEAFCLRFESGGRFTVNLSQVYREYHDADPAARESILQRFVRVSLARHEPDAAGDEAIGKLLPTVRPRSYLELVRLQYASGGKVPAPFPCRVVGGHYCLALMLVEGDALKIVAQHHLDEWGRAFDELLAAATQNLRAVTASAFKPLAGGRVWLGHWGDNFGPSRLLFLDLIRACEVDGDPVVALPDRDMILLTGSDDEAGLLMLADLTEQARHKPRPVGVLPLRLAGDEWRPFLPPSDTQAGAKFRELWHADIGPDYRQQGERLRALFAQRGEEVVAADYHVHGGGQGEPGFSFCVWAQGAGPQLLPRTDQVLFACPDERGELRVRAQVSWSRVREIAGDLMAAQDFYPERWRVDAFPDAERLAALRAASRE
jgi:uncharacterized protein YtpQ (UPF0354 family)